MCTNYNVKESRSLRIQGLIARKGNARTIDWVFKVPICRVGCVHAAKKVCRVLLGPAQAGRGVGNFL